MPNRLPNSSPGLRMRFVLGLAAVLVVVLVGAAAQLFGESSNDIDPGPDGVFHIALWGDSLAHEAATYFDDAFAEQTVAVDREIGTLGGTALCDVTETVRTGLVEADYDAVILAFSGNALTPCMQGLDGSGFTGAAHTAAYREALDQIITVAHDTDTQVFVADGPTARSVSPEATALRAMYRQRADETSGLTYLEVDSSLLEDGRYTDTLPCLLIEGADRGCVDGRIVVRAPDGGHFCPDAPPAIGGVTVDCPHWSSGAFRYAHALADPVIDRLRPDAA